MSKKIYSLTQWKTSGSFERGLAFQFYITKYFNIFMGSYKFTGGITREQQDFILRKLWAEGKIAGFIVEGTRLEADEVPSDVNQYPNGMIAFAPFAPFMFNIYDWPIQVNLISLRGANFIPTTPQVVNKDVVIGYAQRSKKSVASVVEYYVQKIVDVDMTIRVQLKSHKVPWLVATTPENEAKLKALFDKVNNDEEVLYLSQSEIEAIKLLIGGNSYIIDKLYSYRQSLENELLTFLGVDNIGIMEKKEHLIQDEIASNNDLIRDHSDNFLSCMREFFDKINELWGFNYGVEPTSAPVEPLVEEEEQEEDEDEYVEE